MLNSYETVFILTPVLSDAQMKEAVEKFRNMILRMEAKLSMRRTGAFANWLILSTRSQQVFIT